MNPLPKPTKNKEKKLKWTPVKNDERSETVSCQQVNNLVKDTYRKCNTCGLKTKDSLLSFAHNNDNKAFKNNFVS